MTYPTLKIAKVIDLYRSYCESNNISFKVDDSVKPYDDTTLFCPAGMQQFKDKFKNPDDATIANSQSCIRLQDLDEIGDGSHLLYFNMLGLFSFGELTMQQTIHFWMRFLNDILKVKIDYVTIHPDNMILGSIFIPITLIWKLDTIQNVSGVMVNSVVTALNFIRME